MGVAVLMIINTSSCSVIPALVTASLMVLLFSLGCAGREDTRFPLRQSQAPHQNTSLFAQQIEKVSSMTDCALLQKHQDSAERFREESVTFKSTEDSEVYLRVVGNQIDQMNCN